MDNKKPPHRRKFFANGPWENRTPAFRMQTGCTTTMLTAQVINYDIMI